MAGEQMRQSSSRSPAVAPQVWEALHELAQLSSTQPSLTCLTRLFMDLLPRLFDDPVPEVPPTSLGQDTAAAKVPAGIPLLRNERLALDVQAGCRRWQQICTAVQLQRTDDASPRLAEALGTGRLDLQDLLQAVLDGRPDYIHAAATAHGLDDKLMGMVLRLTLFPVLAHVSMLLVPLRAGCTWERGWCPVCGSWPLLGEFRGLEQIRFLRCELCAASWEFARLHCPFCGTRDHHWLGYLHVEGEESTCRAATCDQCHGYVKMIATLGELSAPRLLVADLATTFLDLAAADRGYARPPFPIADCGLRMAD